jgi:hypothetical protein
MSSTEVCRPFRTWGRDSPGCEGINPFAGVCRRLRGFVEDSTSLSSPNFQSRLAGTHSPHIPTSPHPHILSSSHPHILTSSHVQVPLRRGMSSLQDLGKGLPGVRRDKSLRWSMSPPSGLCGGLHLSFITKFPIPARRDTFSTHPHIPTSPQSSHSHILSCISFKEWMME